MFRNTYTRRLRTLRPMLCRLEDRLAPATYVVSNVNNTGSGSLRLAIASANANSGNDYITFSSFFATPRTITLTSGEIDISDSVNIQGPGASLLTVSGNNASRVFDVSGTGTPNSIFSGMRIANGKVAGSGAGVRNQGEFVSLIDCTLSNNVATGASGGAVSSIGGTLHVYSSEVTGNQAGANGGGVDANSGASVYLTLSTIANNSATGQGGGVGVGSSSLVVERSTISGNTANGSGGGAYFAGDVGPNGLILRNSTFSGNTAKQSGGAVQLSNHAGTLVVQNCTLTANSATTLGGAIRQSGGTGAIAIESSIVSNNAAGSYSDVSNSLHPATMKYSALGSTSGFTFSDLGGNLPFGSNLMLTALINTGGVTKTHNPMFNSPLIDAGSNPSGATLDQRNTGNPRVVNARADIGAVESQYLVVTNANNGGPGSLRQAVADANAITGVDAITFDPAYFAVPRTITLSSGEILISDPIFVHGPGATRATVSGNDTNRAFHVNGPGTIAATINHLTIADGKAAGAGGGILSAAENLTLNDCVLSGNSATGAGAAVSSPGGGFLTLNRCVVAGNQSNGNGGAIDANGGASVTLNDTTVAGNYSAGQGGGIGIGSSNLMVNRTTVSGNTANGSGGGLYIAASAGTSVTVRMSTFSANKASGQGGGIELDGVSGTLLVQNSTFAGNTAGIKGGGIVVDPSAGTLALQASILQNNTAGIGPDVAAAAATAQNCALGTINGITTFSNLGGNLIGQDIKLGPLADNGGYTQTHALLDGSPCIDAGFNPSLATIDQRGAIRSVGLAVDIGPFEVQPTPATVTAVVLNIGETQRSRVTCVTVTFNEQVVLPTNPADAFQLQRQLDGAYVTLAASVAGNAVTLSFIGGPVEAKSLADGRYTLRVLAAQLVDFDGNGDGTVGDNYTLVGDPATNKLFRLFGDADGDGDVDASDFGAFRTAFGGASSTWDFDSDGDVDSGDFGAFRGRFGAGV